MNETRPPIQPGQLPPRTDDFTFCNVSNHPMSDVHFEADGPGGPFLGHIPGPGPHTTAVLDVHQDLHANRVRCHTDVGGAHLEFEFDDTPPGWFVAQMICGAVDGHDGSAVPFGTVILRGPTDPEICAVAIQFQNAMCP